MTTILNYNIYSKLTGCTTNNQQLINRLIEESEFYDFKKLVGETIYKGIVVEVNGENGISDELKAILEKGAYKCIAYLTYANYLTAGHVANTYSGAMQKSNPYSEQISLGDRKNLAIRYKDLASEYLKGSLPELQQYFPNTECNKEGYRNDRFSEIIGVTRFGRGNRSVEILDF